MRASELYIGHPELMTPGEREESDFGRRGSKGPDVSFVVWWSTLRHVHVSQMKKEKQSF